MGFKEAIEAANSAMQRGERQTDRYAGLLAQKRELEMQNRQIAMQNLQMYDQQIDDLDWLRNTSDEDKGRFMYTRNQYAAQVGAPEWQQVPDRREGDWAGDVFNLQASMRQASTAKDAEMIYLAGKQQLVQKYGLNWWAKNMVNLQNMATQSGSFDLQPQGAGVKPEQKPQTPQAEPMPKSATDEQSASGEGQLTPSATPSTDIPQKPVTSYSIDEMFDAIFRPYIPTEKTRQEEIEGWNKLYSVIKPTAGGVKPPQGLQVEYWQRGVKLGFVQPLGEVKWENGEPIPSQADLEALDTEFTPHMTENQEALRLQSRLNGLETERKNKFKDIVAAYSRNETPTDMLKRLWQIEKIQENPDLLDHPQDIPPMPEGYMSLDAFDEETRQNINLKRDELKWKQEYQKANLDFNKLKETHLKEYRQASITARNAKSASGNIPPALTNAINTMTRRSAGIKAAMADGYYLDNDKKVKFTKSQLAAMQSELDATQQNLDIMTAQRDRILGSAGIASPDGSVDTGEDTGSDKLRTKFSSATQTAISNGLRQLKKQGKFPGRKATIKDLKRGHPNWSDAEIGKIWDYINTRG